MAHVFAGLGKKIFLFEDKNGKKKFRQVLWGDYLEIDDDRQEQNGFLPIIWAKKNPAKRKELWEQEEGNHYEAAVGDCLCRCRAGRRFGADHSRRRQE
jgi:hypothetical protein